MANTDTILTETTVSGFLTAINQKYQLNLPTDFSDDSAISQLLKQPITVSPGGEKTTIIYTARGSPLDFPPFNFGVNLEPPLHSIVIITVTQEST